MFVIVMCLVLLNVYLDHFKLCGVCELRAKSIDCVLSSHHIMADF